MRPRSSRHRMYYWYHDKYTFHALLMKETARSTANYIIFI